MKALSFVTLFAVTASCLWSAPSRAASEPKTVHCKVAHLILNDRPKWTESTRVYMVRFECQEDVTKVFKFPNGLPSPHETANWVNFNRYTTPLLERSENTGEILEVEITSAYFTPVLKLNGVDVGFNDDTSVIPAAPAQQTALEPGQKLVISGSAFADAVIASGISLRSASGASFATDRSTARITISGETDRDRLSFGKVTPYSPTYLVYVEAPLARSIIEALNASGFPSRTYQVSHHGSSRTVERYAVDDGREGCNKTTYHKPKRVLYSCTFEVTDLVIE